jgi:hypothetical protein
VERRQQGGEVEEHQHPVVVEEEAGERQRQVPAVVEVEELADRCSLGALAVLVAAEVGQCSPAAGAEEGEHCSLAGAEDVEEDRLWRVEAAVGCL